MSDLPTFTASAYATRSNRADLWVSPATNNIWTGDNTSWVGDPPVYRDKFDAYRHAGLVSAMASGGNHKEEKQDMAANGKADLRVVRVFLVDPDDRVPIDKRILYRSDEMTTDATDQELFFGIPVNDLLKEHNATRAAVEWEEKTSDGTKTKTGLKEARIRDLVMSVTTIARFESRAAS